MRLDLNKNVIFCIAPNASTAEENTQCHLNDLNKLQAGGESRRHWSLFFKQIFANFIRMLFLNFNQIFSGF